MREAIAFLESAGIEPGEADAGADILLGEITGLSRSAIRSAGSTRVLSDGELEQFRAMILRRGTREPVQYILGEWPFYNLERLKIRPPTLIPRPETEELVEMVLRDAAAAPARFLEVGPGSGAISLALLREWPNTRATAVDLCAHAVELSRENGVLTGLSDRITVEHAGISAWAPPPSLVQAPFDLLVSNPPYIPHAQMATLDPEVVDHEDSVALDGGDDGLDVFKLEVTASVT
ncbi:S-adenosyl-L-methionine-dependent methyltransferase [Baffinella frigidus]|nr:S-adenosyl-L-methionine-dependent methyltransferase [Cryptophyta sp. CCMP2293]